MKTCEIKDCSNNVHAIGLCFKHYMRKRRHGSPNTLKKNPNGFGSVRPDGYKVMTVNGKKKYEHRFIMETHIGRPLKTWEVVHHINHDTSDNRIENLEIIPNRTHTKLHHTTTFRNKTHKQCTKCLVVKPRTQFYIQKHDRLSGDQNSCFCISCNSTHRSIKNSPKKPALQ